MLTDPSIFSIFSDHFINFRNHFYWYHMDIVMRKLMLVNIGGLLKAEERGREREEYSFALFPNSSQPLLFRRVAHVKIFHLQAC